MCTFTSGGFKGGEVRAGAIIGTLMHPTAQTGHRRLLQHTEQGQPALEFPGILRQSAHTHKRFTVIFFPQSIYLSIYSKLSAGWRTPAGTVISEGVFGYLDQTHHFWGNFLGFYSPTSSFFFFFLPLPRMRCCCQQWLAALFWTYQRSPVKYFGGADCGERNHPLDSWWWLDPGN